MLMLYIRLPRPPKDLFAPSLKDPSDGREVKPIDHPTEDETDHKIAEHPRKIHIAEHKRNAQSNYSLERRLFW